MISIIVCSRLRFLFEQVSRNIRESCGVDFEILEVNNAIYKWPLTKAYNYGGLKANNDILVFVHEDVIFHTKDWGKILLNYFETLANPGLLGVAGSSYLPISPTDWWISNQRYIHTNFLSNSKNGVPGLGVLNSMGKQFPQNVFALDGMFLAMRRSVFLEFPFDESMPGFHGYDTDLSYQVSQSYQNYFIPGILIEHFSKGYPDGVWLHNTISANKKILPFILELKSKVGFDANMERKSFHLFLGQLRKFGSSRFENIRLAIFYFNQLRAFNLHWKLIPLLLKYLLSFGFTFKSQNSTIQER
ncbi:glycosyltransferase [Algoriphagus sp. C2-6-M1]|uniref:glycosyltransferase n=1 Tax=Algoriphagus persicinus TaxID=3108754 RepID=UPI002B383596|nr:glycosyltransferase [Algoriphagus sp. C2-6-M1]MEB2782423.1 glycosyltransferase [Algoriphagus sp. C2-6-M1]